MFRRLMYFLYGCIAYLLFFGSFLYAIGFLGNLPGMPTALDAAPGATSTGRALLIDVALLGAFAVQHSVMARRWFKQWWTKFVPVEIERSTYVLFSSALLIALWQPIGITIWTVTDPIGRAALYALYALGLAVVLTSTFLINHFDLFGLRQVSLVLVDRPYTALRFRTPFMYRLVRHPLYVGWLFSFWATPTMTLAHLVFAVATTAYILIAIQFEERDLVREHGRDYIEYRNNVPMLVPFARRGDRTLPAADRAV